MRRAFACWLLVAGLSGAGVAMAACNETAKGECPQGANARLSEEKKTGASEALPPDAAAKVVDLRAQMRFFTAIGFHPNAEENRLAIIAVYEKYGIAVPAEYAVK